MANIKLKNASGQEIVYNGIEKIIVKDENDEDVVYGGNPLIVTNIDTPPEITDVGKFVLNTTDNCMYRIEQAGSNEWVVEGEAGLDESVRYSGVAYGNSVWVVNASGGWSAGTTQRVYYSTDNGHSWTLSNVGATIPSGKSYSMSKVVFAKGKFWIIFNYESASGNYVFLFYYSTDGINWQEDTSLRYEKLYSSPLTLTSYSKLVFTDDKIVFFANNYIFYKISQGSWTLYKFDTTVYKVDSITDMTTNGSNQFVAISNYYSSNYSFDSRTRTILWETKTLSGWTNRSEASSSQVNGYIVLFANGKYISLKSDGVRYSTNGENWTTQTHSVGWFYSVTYGNGMFVAVGQNGLVYKSTDGITWTSMATLDTTRTYWGIATDGSKFVAVGSLGGVARTLPSSSYYYRKLRYDD